MVQEEMFWAGGLSVGQAGLPTPNIRFAERIQYGTVLKITISEMNFGQQQSNTTPVHSVKKELVW